MQRSESARARDREDGGSSVRVCVCVCACVWLCVRVRARARVCESVCVRARARVCLCVRARPAPSLAITRPVRSPTQDAQPVPWAIPSALAPAPADRAARWPSAKPDPQPDKPHAQVGSRLPVLAGRLKPGCAGPKPGWA